MMTLNIPFIELSSQAMDLGSFYVKLAKQNVKQSIKTTPMAVPGNKINVTELLVIGKG